MCARFPFLAAAILLAPISAGATFHLWEITEVYSNADGSVQYIEFSTTANFQDETAGTTLQSSLDSYMFPSNVAPNDSTANHTFLVATPAFASQPGAVAPDFTLDAEDFFDVVADTINYVGADVLSFTSGELPTNGVDALYATPAGVKSTGPNTPQNFAGQVGPEPSGWLMQASGVAGVLGLARWHRRRSG